MIKYFCDLCGTETAEEELYDVLISDYDKKVSDIQLPYRYRRDLCKDCYFNLHAFIEKGSQKGVEHE